MELKGNAENSSSLSAGEAVLIADTVLLIGLPRREPRPVAQATLLLLPGPR